MPSRLRLPVLVLLAGLLVLVAGGLGVGATRAVEPLPVSKALRLLEAGTPQSAAVIGPTASPELRLSVGPRRFSSDLTPELVPVAVAAARTGDVPLGIERPRTQTAQEVAAELRGGGEGFSIGAFLQTWGPLILLAALVIVSGMALRTVGGGKFRQKTTAVRSDTRFDDVAGIDEIRDDISEIVDVLRHPERYEQLGARLPKGAILHGPPGTGKTLLARAVAGEAQVPFFSVSGSEFVEVYAGLGSRRIRTLFAAARKAAPSVVYIDEIDAVGSKRTGHASGGEREQTLDQLLSEMDGFRTDPARPVVVIASTNRLDDLDPALLRSGRFDRKIAVGLPGRAARREILDVHLRERPLTPGVESAAVAAMTVGMAGADLAALCNEAAFEAARAGRTDIDLGHFRRALLRLAAGPERKGRLLSDEERALVAYHEIGHALVGHLSPTCDPVERVTVIPQGQALGITVSLPIEDRFLATRTECMERLAMMLAGRAAEELVFDEFTSGAGDDLAWAATLARRMVSDLAMASDTTSASLIVALPGAGTTASADAVETAAQRLVQEAFHQAREMLSRHRDLLERGAEALLDNEALERDQVAALFGPRPGLRRLRVGSA
jgi:cell division protease FtsH